MVGRRALCAKSIQYLDRNFSKSISAFTVHSAMSRSPRTEPWSDEALLARRRLAAREPTSQELAFSCLRPKLPAGSESQSMIAYGTFAKWRPALTMSISRGRLNQPTTFDTNGTVD
jgi:hypothetical protein